MKNYYCETHFCNAKHVFVYDYTKNDDKLYEVSKSFIYSSNENSVLTK